jgi:hypothetical protein
VLRPTDVPILIRVFAAIVAAVLAAMSGMQLHWALGGSWGLSEVSGGQWEELSRNAAIGSAVLAVALFLGGLAVLGHAGFWGDRVPFRYFHRTTALLTVALAIAGLANVVSSTAWERYLFGPVGLVLAVLAFGVARNGEYRRKRYPLPPFPTFRARA